jgi:inositol transport system ATP-binding protein
MGAGRTEVLETIFGIHRAEAGEIAVDGKTVRIHEPSDAIRAGLGLLTEDRKGTGIMSVLSVRDNMFSAALRAYSKAGFIQGKRVNAAAQEQREALAIKTPSLRQLIANLSGGNQQKVLISRWLLTLPEILMIDEPTRGIDVGAKYEIYGLINELADQGKGVVMISSELPELLGMCDRIYTVFEGRITGEADAKTATQESLMRQMTDTAA